MNLDAIKTQYEREAKRYSLPSFKELNDFFELDKIKKESDNFIRTVRKTMMEKVVNTLGFIDMLLNPVNAPRMYFQYLKSLTESEKEDLDNIYKVLAHLSILSLEREISYNEKAEADLVKKIFKDWRTLAPEFERMTKKMKAPINSPNRKEKSYFG